MKRITLILACAVIMASGCKKDLASLNVDPKNPSNVPSYTLFTYGQKSLASDLASANVNLNIFKLIAQHWTETTYTDESNYDLASRNITQNWWHTLYRDVLKNFSDAATLIPTDVVGAAKQKNQLAIIDILNVYTYHYIFTTFGNAPFSQALNINNTQPVYDDAKTAYSQLLTKLNTAIANLSVADESFGTADLLFAGDVTMWKKFAYSLKLKMGMVMVDYDAAAAKTAVEDAATKAFTSNADNAYFNFLSAPPNTNPLWVDLVQSGRQDFVGANTLVDKMNSLNDPRVPLFFTTDNVGGYSGGIYGSNNNYATYSKPNQTLTNPTHAYNMLDYSEVEFLLAEAVERGFTVSGTAQSHYNKAITASITAWGGSSVDATTYLAQSNVDYIAASGTYKEKIGTQKWIALYDRGCDAWIEWRRFDYPALVAPSSAISAIPVRFTYPVSEQNLNGTNYAAASTAIGTDKVTTKLWFDKF